MKAKVFFGAALALAMGLSVCGLAACGKETPTDPPPVDPPPPATPAEEGWYVLTSKTVDGADVTGDYLYNAIRLSDGGVAWYEADYSGLKTTEGTYTRDGQEVEFSIGEYTKYAFTFDEAAKTLSCSRTTNRQKVVWNYAQDADFVLPSAEGGAAFTEELFGDDITKNFYNYCPTALMEGNDTMHVWYCSNKDDGLVYDYIAYRKGTLNAAGKWEFSEKQLVLSHSDSGWDDKHTCDPSVVKGEFALGGETYSYLMTYLGCTQGDINEVGFAVAKAPEGPWQRVGNGLFRGYKTQDEYRYQNEYNAANPCWGYGQPSLVNVDGKGDILLFYTKGIPSGTNVYVEEWDLSNLSAPVYKRGAPVSSSGAAGDPIAIRNADFAYDPHENKIYCLYDPFPDESGYAVVRSEQLLSLKLGKDGVDLLFKGGYTWSKVGTVSTADSGKFLNHNGAILTDAYGRLTNPYRVPVLYTTASSKQENAGWSGNGQWPYLHTYRIRGKVFENVI